MASESCDACGADVPIGGGISGFWSSDPQGTGGMTLELTDGTEHFLCFACIEQLPDDPSAGDVRSLEGDRLDDAAIEEVPTDDGPSRDAADEPVGDGTGGDESGPDGDG